MPHEIFKRPQAERDIEECFVFIAEDNLDTGVYFLGSQELTETRRTFEFSTSKKN